MRKRTVAAIIGALALLPGTSCQQAILTAPNGSTLQLVANPTFIPASSGVSIISALLIEPAGTPVADGTVVQFFTTLGVIDEQGKTNDGVVRVNLVADSRSGTAQVTAFSGTATSSGAVDVTIGSALPERIVMTAQPIRIVSEPFARIIANVFDTNGNPTVNVPVVFSVSTASGSELEVRLAGGGAQVFTDNNGRAEDALVIESPLGGAQETVTVTVTAADGVTASVEVTVN